MVSSAISSALRGFAAATQRLNVSASNIANADSTQTEVDSVISNTPYVPLQVAQSNSPTGTVNTSTQAVTPASVSLYDPSNAAADAKGITQYPNVDITQQLVQTKLATYTAAGSVAVIKAENKMYQSMLNIVS